MSGQRVIVFLAWVLLGMSAAAFAQDRPATPPDAPRDSEPETRPVAEVTAERLDTLTKQIEAATDLSDEHRQKANEAVKNAAESLKAYQDLLELEQRSKQRIETADEERQRWEERIRELQVPVQKAWLGEPLPTLEQTLARKQSVLLQAQTDLERIQTRIEQRPDRQRTIRERITSNPRDLEEIKQQIDRLATSTDPPLVTEARRMRLLAEQKRLEPEPRVLQSELAAMAAQDAVNLLQLERQYHAEKVSRLREEVASWSQAVTRRRRLDAEDRAELARSMAARAEIETLQRIYEDNAGIVERELAVRLKQSRIQAESEAARHQTATLMEDFAQVRARGERIGASAAFGIRLREQRQALREPGTDPILLRRAVRQRIQEFEEAFIERQAWKERRGNLDRIDDEVASAVQAVVSADTYSDEVIAQLEVRFRAAFEQQRMFIDHLENAYDDYINGLDTLELEQLALADESEKFIEYIEKRVLWIPSHGALTLDALTADVETAHNLIDPVAWGDLVSFLGEDARRAPWWYVLAVLFWIAMLASQKRVKAAMRRHGQKATSRLNTSMRPTGLSLFWTMVKSLVIPFPFLILAWRISHSAAPEHLLNLSRYVALVSWGILALEFVRNVSRSYGLGVAHFGWPKRVNELVTRQVVLYLTVAAPLAFVVAILHSRREEGGTDALERVLAILMSVLLAYVLHRLTSRKEGIVQEWIEDHPNGWLDRLSGLWHLIAFAVPLFLAGLTASGYAYAAERLSVRLIQTLLMVYGAVFLRAYLFRWLTLRQRRLAIEQAREIRAAMAARAELEGDTSAAAAQGVQEAHSNLADVSSQAKRLLNTTIVITLLAGVWLIWVDVLPALHYFDEWTIPGTEVSLASSLAALVVIALTTTAGRNIPGLLEITLLEKLPLDKSVRYAVGALTQYAIVFIGLLTVSNILGIEWEKVQWLAAALTFGLGFGLQEIFANFVSGLIILFEQPVRVGDVVTIDGVTGSVSRIRIRSTTITDWDRKEYVVPNKEFITGRLLNWTLTDTTNRLTIKVGVSYGSDPERVREILLDVVRTQEHVLADPEPRVFFEGFGDSSLDFSIFVFLPTFEHRLATIHALHSRIHKAFGDANIEIPFPQRDLHVRSPIPIPHTGSSPSETPSVPDEPAL